MIGRTLANHSWSLLTTTKEYFSKRQYTLSRMPYLDDFATAISCCFVQAAMPCLLTPIGAYRYAGLASWLSQR